MSRASQFDPASGRLRLALAHVGALPALLAEEPTIDPEVVSGFSEGGIMLDGQLDPRLVPVARCVGSPLVRLTVDHAAPVRWRMDSWIDDRIAVLVRTTDASDPVGDVAAIPRGMVALQLARQIGLAPRRRVKVDAPVELDDGLVEAVLGSGESWSASAIEAMLSDGDELLPEWVELLSVVSGQEKRRWRMGTWWNSIEESPAARVLEIVEADAGSFLLTHRRYPERRYRRARLYPVTSTQIWRLLAALVPSPEEVDRPLGD